MAHGQPAGPEVLLDRRGQPEEAERVGDGRPVLAEAPGQLLLGPAELGQEALVGLGRLERVQVLPEEVLDQAELEGLGVARLAHDGRHPRQPRLLGGAPAALPDQDLVLVPRGVARRAAGGCRRTGSRPPARRAPAGRSLRRGCCGFGTRLSTGSSRSRAGVLGLSGWQQGAQAPSECALHHGPPPPWPAPGRRWRRGTGDRTGGWTARGSAPRRAGRCGESTVCEHLPLEVSLHLGPDLGRQAWSGASKSVNTMPSISRAGLARARTVSRVRMSWASPSSA